MAATSTTPQCSPGPAPHPHLHPHPHPHPEDPHPHPDARQVWRLLGLRPPTESERREAEGGAAKDELEQVRAEHGEPPAAPFARVRAFYAPFNAALAAQLGDRAFLWGWPEQDEQAAAREAKAK